MSAQQKPLPAQANEKVGLETETNTINEGSEKQVKLGEDGEDGFVEDVPPAVIIPLKYRITAIILIILFGTGNTYAGFVLGPLKTRLVRELKISSESTVLPS